MKLEDIYNFYQKPQPRFLNQELAVCYVLSVLLEGDSYGTELIQRLEQEFPPYRLSDTVLYEAFKFLEAQEFIQAYWKKVDGRGRPRRMFQLVPNYHERAREFATLWQTYLHGSSTLATSSDAIGQEPD